MDRLGIERIESFKAGLVGGISTGLVFLLTLLLHRAMAQSAVVAIAPLPTTLFTSTGLVSVLAAGITGFLFGVTYRYIVRRDANPQLRTGVVFAFGLVRGLAQMDVGLALSGTLWAVLLLAVESLLVVAIARLSLDWAIAQGWVKPFGMVEQPPIEKVDVHHPSSSG